MRKTISHSLFHMLFVSREKSTKNALLLATAGIGDFLAFESFFAAQFRHNIKTVFYATNAHNAIRLIIDACPEYKVNHVLLSDCHLTSRSIKTKLLIEPHVLDNTEEIAWYCFNRCLNYNCSVALTNKLAVLPSITLPKDFLVLCPYSNWNPVPGRNFTKLEWKYVAKIKRNLVVLNTGDEPVLKYDHIIDLSNKTTFGQAVEILKLASGYIGIDSALSVLAAKLFPVRNLLILAKRDLTYRFKHIYYAPKTEFSFLVKDFHLPENIRMHYSS